MSLCICGFKKNEVSLQHINEKNEQEFFTYPPSRYYYSLTEQVEVSLVGS